MKVVELVITNDKVEIMVDGVLSNTIDECTAIIITDNRPLEIGLNYYAIPDGDFEKYWYIVDKYYYAKYNCVSDHDIDLDIPGFFQCRESCFEDVLGLSYEQQKETLTKMGFTIREDLF